MRADTVDVAVSIYALGAVDDLDRVFRQVHRVLRPEAPFVFSLPHPAFRIVRPRPATRRRCSRSYFDRTADPWTVGDEAGSEYPTHDQRPVHRA